MSLSQRAAFCRRLGTGFRAGLDVVRLCQSEARVGSARHRQVMSDVSSDVANGESLAKAMRNQGRYFSPLLVQMVHVGESTGRLERTLLALADHYEERAKLRKIFLTGIAWPVTQLVAALTIIGLAILLQGLLAGPSGPAMDASGLGLSGVSGFITYCVSIAAIAAVLTALALAIRANFLSIHRLIPLCYRIPVAGPALQTITLSRVCWTLALTLDAGLDAIRSVKLALLSAGNAYYRDAIPTAEAAIRAGQSLHESLAATGVFPRDFLEGLEVAEMSGTDAESLDRMAQGYEGRAKFALSVLIGVSTFVIWAAVAILIIFFIIRLFMNYVNTINSFAS